MEFTDIAFTAKPSCKLCIISGISLFTKHAANYLLDTGAGVNQICSSMLPPCWTNRIKRQNVRQVQTATKQLLTLDGLILLHLHLGKLSTRIWFGVDPHIAVETLLGT